MHLAPEAAEDPVAHYLLGQRERHDDEANQEVWHGQRGDEPILDSLQRLLSRDGDAHQHVAHHDQDHDHSHEEGRQNDACPGVSTRVFPIRSFQYWPIIHGCPIVDRAVLVVRRIPILPVELVVHGQQAVAVVKEASAVALHFSGGSWSVALQRKTSGEYLFTWGTHSHPRYVLLFFLGDGFSASLGSVFFRLRLDLPEGKINSGYYYMLWNEQCNKLSKLKIYLQMSKSKHSSVCLFEI